VRCFILNYTNNQQSRIATLYCNKMTIQDLGLGLAHGLISYFLLINFQCQQEVDLDCVQYNSQVFAVISPLIPHPDIKLANDTLTGASVSHIVPYYHPNYIHVAVHVLAILEKLVYMFVSKIVCP